MSALEAMFWGLWLFGGVAYMAFLIRAGLIFHKQEKERDEWMRKVIEQSKGRDEP